MVTVIAAVIAAFFLVMGCAALIRPTEILRPFGIRVDTAAARSEVRAVYGGFGVAMAAILVVAAVQGGDLRTGITLTVAAALAGMAVGRLVSALLDRRTAFYPVWFYFLVEAVAAAALFTFHG
ncbi:DUF4345 domain-containing protein [Nocardia inohanensis]|uniref:DUF4345 domain-containing protein n=1 Tax=Nocardia inohanensis TaxID=209246 RepID=UPI000835BCC7|nr:DUF4345 domain-containing protein [Nocardia inohanensis]